MPYKKIIPYINAENEMLSNVLQLTAYYNNSGADELLIYNYSKDNKSQEEFLGLVRKISRTVDIPITVGCYVNRLEDIKKALYTGASAVLIKLALLENRELLKDASERFGSGKIMLELDMTEYTDPMAQDLIDSLKAYGIGKLLLKHVVLSDHLKERMSVSPFPIVIRDSLTRNDITCLMALPDVYGVATDFFENKSIMKAKYALKEEGVEVNILESTLPFNEFKLNEDGLIPVITQDEITGDVLMLAYMNEEAYNRTIAGGRMTYFSRSRNELWLKGETSGNFQYVREMKLDCDKDTLLAKVRQLGPACHTGSRSCFFTTLVERERKAAHPSHILEDVYEIILDRRKNPKEGSYTNYLFDMGIDKILKKCGEEAAEIIIAAKNAGSEELRYEIADYLYHLMILMAECGLDWNDIMTELANRK